MKHISIHIALLVALSLLLTGPAEARSDIWVTAYLASWTLNMGPTTDGNYGNLPYQNIDLEAMTHITMFALAVDFDGTIYYNNLVSSRRRPFNDYIHTNGLPILVSVGGAGNTAFSSAISSPNRSLFISNLLAVLDSNQYDGIDIDMEPIGSEDTVDYKIFVHELHDSLQTRAAFWNPSRKPLLTAAILPSWEGEMFVGLEDQFDQINLMTYDMGGTWFEKTWHNNAIYSRTNGVVNEADKDVYGVEMTTIEKRWEQQMSFGGGSPKYGIGIDFYGYIWTGGSGTPTGGVTAPRQTWSVEPSVQENVDYPTLRAEYLDTITGGQYRWDATAYVPYLSIDKPGSSHDQFISFTDELACTEMVAYSKTIGAGGIIIWELGGGYLPASYDSRDRLLQSIKTAVILFGDVPSPPSPLSPADGSTGVTINPVLSWTSSSGASSYRLEVSTSPAFAPPLIDQKGIIDTSVALSDMMPETTLYWRVKALNAVGAGSWSAVARFRTTIIPGIRGTVYFDANTNGVKDAGEPGMSGWNVYISGTLGASTMTDANGDYHFDSLTWGPYTVGEYSKTSWSQTDPTSPTTYVAVLDTGQPVFDADFGNHSLEAFSFPVIQYWNILSLPLDVFDKGVTAVFPTTAANVFAFRNHSYTQESTLSLGEGYWVKFHAHQLIWLAGQPLTGDTIEVTRGWNLVGALGTSLSTSAISSDPPDIVNPDIFGYDRGFVKATSLEPGQGYWIEASDSGRIFLSPSAAPSPSAAAPAPGVESGNSLTIVTRTGEHQTLFFGRSDLFAGGRTYELPPPPPSGIFDARFPARNTASQGTYGQSCELIGENPIHLPITIQGTGSPATVEWNVHEDGYRYALYTGGLRLLSLEGVGKAAIDLPDRAGMAIGVARSPTAALPSTFAIVNNYPNPFNPGTNIVTDLPLDAGVKLEVYNILGERVALLADQRMSAGRHVIRFDATGLPGGVYMVRMNANPDGGTPVNRIHRMLLMK